MMFRVPAKHKGRTTGHADFETTEGLCADLFTGKVGCRDRP